MMLLPIKNYGNILTGRSRIQCFDLCPVFYKVSILKHNELLFRDIAEGLIHWLLYTVLMGYLHRA